MLKNLLRRPLFGDLAPVHEQNPGTGKYVGEGFDCSRLDTLFLALPVSWKGIVAQYAGRLHRDYPGKKIVQVYDYIDIHVPICDVQTAVERLCVCWV